MQEIKISVDKLLPIVEQNLEAHLREYDEACLDYKNLCIKQLKEKLKVAKNMEPEEPEDVNVFLTKPISHEKEYRSIMAQLKFSFDSEVVLDEREFSRYVEDNWEWKQAFISSNAFYKSSL